MRLAAKRPGSARRTLVVRAQRAEGAAQLQQALLGVAAAAVVVLPGARCREGRSD